MTKTRRGWNTDEVYSDSGGEKEGWGGIGDDKMDNFTHTSVL
jgi:hypothetical protein